jgi:hypothetical protein
MKVCNFLYADIRQEDKTEVIPEAEGLAWAIYRFPVMLSKPWTNVRFTTGPQFCPLSDQEMKLFSLFALLSFSSWKIFQLLPLQTSMYYSLFSVPFCIIYVLLSLELWMEESFWFLCSLKIKYGYCNSVKKEEDEVCKERRHSLVTRENNIYKECLLSLQTFIFFFLYRITVSIFLINKEIRKILPSIAQERTKYIGPKRKERIIYRRVKGKKLEDFSRRERKQSK